MLTRLIVALALFLAAAPARSEDIPPDAVRIELLSGWRTADGRHIAGVRLKLRPGWKTYWRIPGEAGYPPRLSFAGSRNLAAAQVRWPAPVVFDRAGYRSIGYTESVVLPLELRPETAGAPVTLDVMLRIGVCREVCIPVSARLRAELPETARRPNPAIAEALMQMPRLAEVDARCRVEAGPHGPRLTALLSLPPLGAREAAVMETATPGALAAPAETRREGDRLRVSTAIRPESSAGLDRSELRLTVLSEGRAVEIRGCDR